MKVGDDALLKLANWEAIYSRDVDEPSRPPSYVRRRDMEVGDVYERLTVLELYRGYSWYENGLRKQISPAARIRCSCGTEKIVNRSALVSGSTRSCGCLHREGVAALGRANAGAANFSFGKFGADNPAWKGGRFRAWHGDVYIWIGPGTRGAIYRPEHCLVMEGMLGRPLLRRETVHHVNEVRADNRPENLRLFANRLANQRYGKGIATAKDLAYHAEQMALANRAA